jgi:hypothetical protein
MAFNFCRIFPLIDVDNGNPRFLSRCRRDDPDLSTTGMTPSGVRIDGRLPASGKIGTTCRFYLPRFVGNLRFAGCAPTPCRRQSFATCSRIISASLKVAGPA